MTEPTEGGGPGLLTATRNIAAVVAPWSAAECNGLALDEAAGFCRERPRFEAGHGWTTLRRLLETVHYSPSIARSTSLKLETIGMPGAYPDRSICAAATAITCIPAACAA